MPTKGERLYVKALEDHRMRQEVEKRQQMQSRDIAPPCLSFEEVKQNEIDSPTSCSTNIPRCSQFSPFPEKIVNVELENWNNIKLRNRMGTEMKWTENAAAPTDTKKTNGTKPASFTSLAIPDIFANFFCIYIGLFVTLALALSMAAFAYLLSSYFNA